MSEAVATPEVWVVTLGYNRAADTLACLESLAETRRSGLTTLFVDNGSADGSAEQVRQRFPDVRVLRSEENLGFTRGFNVGLAHALRHGATHVFMVNNDTIVDPDLVPRLLEASLANADAGILVPKILFHDAPDRVWAAGSRFRAFPPAIVTRRTPGPDDGRYDGDVDLEFATTCALLLTRRLLETVGLLDTNFFFYCDDYDLCLRAREAGFAIRFVPGARMWHKVSQTTRGGSLSEFFWRTAGCSEAVFCRKHRRYRWMTGPVHRLYLLARLIAEGHANGLSPFLRGWREGARLELAPVPRWDGAGTAAAEPVA